MTEFRQSHRSTTPKWSSFSSQGGDFVLPAPRGPTAPATDCNRGPPSQQQSPIQTQNLNQEETARQRRGNRTSNTPRTASRPPPTLAPTSLQLADSAADPGLRGLLGKGTKGRNGIGGLPVESGSPAVEDQATAARRGRRASSRGVAVGEVRR